MNKTQIHPFKIYRDSKLDLALTAKYYLRHKARQCRAILAYHRAAFWHYINRAFATQFGTAKPHSWSTIPRHPRADV